MHIQMRSTIIVENYCTVKKNVAKTLFRTTSKCYQKNFNTSPRLCWN